MSSNKNALLPILKLSYNGKEIDLDSITILLLKPLFLLFMYFAAFGRSSGIGGLSGGMTAVLFSFAIFALTLLHYLFVNKNKGVSPLFWLVIIFFLYLVAKPMASFLVFGERSTSIVRFVIEILVNFGMLFAVYYSIKAKLLTPKFYLYVLAIFGAIITFQLLGNLSGRSTLRRISGLGGALNYTGSVLAMSAVVWAMIIFRYAKKNKTKLYVKLSYIILFFIVFLGLILTGTRAGIISFIAGMTLLQLFGMQSKKFIRYLLIITVITLTSFSILSFYIDFSLLLDRFTYETLSRGAASRFSLYLRSVNDLTLSEFFFGRPDFYTFTDGIEGARIVNTHNLFLSLIRYNGLLSFVLFLFILAGIYYSYLKIYIKRNKNQIFRLTEASIIILLTMSLIYSMFSGGRSTKIFIVFIQLGFSIGYIELIRNVNSVKDYKKLIL